MSDVECSYCEKSQGINHDGGYGYDEGKLHQQQCVECDKIFTYTTSISFYYEAQKVDCLNGGEHKWKASHTYPKEYTKMVCEECEEERQPTNEEWGEINGTNID